MVQVTEELIKKTTGEFDLQGVYSLNLDGIGIRVLENLGGCVNLSSASFAGNKIQNLSGLSQIQGLRKLDISGNLVNSFDTMPVLPNLEVLLAQGNAVRGLDSLSVLQRVLPKLNTLYLMDPNGQKRNPVCKDPKYRDLVLALFPAMRNLDGDRIKGGRKNSNASLAALKQEVETLPETTKEVLIPKSQPWFKHGDFAIKPAPKAVALDERRYKSETQELEMTLRQVGKVVDRTLKKT